MGRSISPAETGPAWHNVEMDILHVIAERKIREALERGDLDRVEGSGKPLPEDAFADTPAELRAGFRVLKNAGFVPEEVQLQGDIRRLEDLIQACPDLAADAEPRNELRVKRLRYARLMERWRGSALTTAYCRRLRERLGDKRATPGPS